RLAVREACRVLQPGGRLIIVESCVPPWFYAVERAVFPVAAPLINKVSAHPATLQYPAADLASVIEQCAGRVEIVRIPKGRWILQFGYKFPSVLTPATPYRFVARRPSAPG